MTIANLIAAVTVAVTGLISPGGIAAGDLPATEYRSIASWFFDCPGNWWC